MSSWWVSMDGRAVTLTFLHLILTFSHFADADAFRWRRKHAHPTHHPARLPHHQCSVTQVDSDKSSKPARDLISRRMFSGADSVLGKSQSREVVAAKAEQDSHTTPQMPQNASTQAFISSEDAASKFFAQNSDSQSHRLAHSHRR